MKINRYKIILIGIGIIILISFSFPIYLKVKLFVLQKSYKEEVNKEESPISNIEEFTLSEIIGTIGESHVFKIESIDLLEDGGEVIINSEGSLETVQEGLDIIKSMDFISDIKNINFYENKYSITIIFKKNK